jgi:hypothetical protein
LKEYIAIDASKKAFIILIIKSKWSGCIMTKIWPQNLDRLLGQLDLVEDKNLGQYK